MLVFANVAVGQSGWPKSTWALVIILARPVICRVCQVSCQGLNPWQLPCITSHVCLQISFSSVSKHETLYQKVCLPLQWVSLIFHFLLHGLHSVLLYSGNSEFYTLTLFQLYPNLFYMWIYLLFFVCTSYMFVPVVLIFSEVQFNYSKVQCSQVLHHLSKNNNSC